MGRRMGFRFWAGFLTVAVLGTLSHFVYEWSGSVLAGAFCAVNESTWEHMKLLFFPTLLFTLTQLFWPGDRERCFPAVRAVSVTVGLAAIPTLFYTYIGVLGRMVSWVNILIFYLADAGLFLLDGWLCRWGRLRRPWQQVAGLIWLWVLALLFVWWTFRPPHIG